MKTASMLQRVPAILAVTAHAYGLAWQAGAARRPAARQERRHDARSEASGSDKPAARR